MRDKTIFILEDRELEQTNQWIEQQKKKYGKKTGALGDRFSYTFSPTGLGTVIIVKDHFTGEEKDVTDYDIW